MRRRCPHSRRIYACPRATEDHGGLAGAQRRGAPRMSMHDATREVPMNWRKPLTSKRFTRGIAAIITIGAVGAVSACADPSAPARRPSSPSAIIIIGGHPIVFNAQLRAIGNPDEKPIGAVVGHLQLKISESDETGLVVSWQVH